MLMCAILWTGVRVPAPPPNNLEQGFSLAKAPVMYDPALSAFYAWISCSVEMSQRSPTGPAFGLASRPKTHIEALFSLFAALFSVAFGLLHLSPKEILISGLVHFATIPRSKDWSSECYCTAINAVASAWTVIRSRRNRGDVFR